MGAHRGHFISPVPVNTHFHLFLYSFSLDPTPCTAPCAPETRCLQSLCTPCTWYLTIQCPHHSHPLLACFLFSPCCSLTCPLPWRSVWIHCPWHNSRMASIQPVIHALLSGELSNSYFPPSHLPFKYPYMHL